MTQSPHLNRTRALIAAALAAMTLLCGPVAAQQPHTATISQLSRLMRGQPRP